MHSGSGHIGTADPQKLMDIIGAGLDAHTRQSGTPLYVADAYAISSKDDEGNVIGGLTGKFFWDWLEIELLWVDAHQRGHGLGAALVRKAIEDAQARKCSGIFLWTQSWQAPAFYQKLGFTPFVTLPDFPQGRQRIGLRMLLQDTVPERLP